MPELSKSIRYYKALEELSRHLKTIKKHCRSLTTSELEKRSCSDKVLEFSDGWFVLIQCADKEYELEYLIDRNFPYSFPKVALVDKAVGRRWPHLVADGSLCLMPNNGEIDSRSPAAVFDSQITEAHDLIARCVGGELDSDFGEEFLSYWRNWVEKPDTKIFGLLRPEGPTRHIKLVEGPKALVACEDLSEAQGWLCNRYGEQYKTAAWKKALFVWLGSPPELHGFSRSNHSILSWLDGLDRAGRKVVQKAFKRPECLIIFGFDTGHGVAYAGVEVTTKEASKAVKGRQKVIEAQLADTSQTKLYEIQRVDHGWVHGRGYDERSLALKQKNVVVIGCGSVGSMVTKLLAESGVGTIHCIDPDELAWANIGRHALGSESIGKVKSDAMAEYLRRQFPHLSFASHGVFDWQYVYGRNPEVLEKADLIVSATGSWCAEGQLNDLALQKAEAFPPVLYGWTEPHGVAGHAVTIPADHGCFACEVDHFGSARTVAEWEKGTETLREPACGTFFQPYGPIELSFINALIADAALAALLNEPEKAVRSTWIAQKGLVEESGGKWSSDWIDRHGDPGEGGYRTLSDWGPEIECSICGRKE